MPFVIPPDTAFESLLIDPEYDDASNTELTLNDSSTGISLIAQEFPVPDPNPLAVSSFDTEGEAVAGVHYPNREITFKVRVAQTTHVGVESSIGDLQQKVAKINREGGTLGRVTMGGGTILFDVQTANIQVPLDWQYALAKNVECELKFTALPFGRGVEVEGDDHTETSSPVLVFVDDGPPGDVLALTRLVIDEDEGADQWTVLAGIQSRYYSSDATAALFFEAEDLTPQGGSATNTGPSGASGTSVMRSADLATSFVSILSTQINGGSHLSHIGSYRLFLRVQAPTANTGGLQIALQWGEGDFRKFTTNDPVVFPVDSWDGQWLLIDLGQVHLTKATAGTQQWEGRILAKSTVAGDKIDVDHLFLLPVGEGATEISAVPQSQTPTVFLAQDGFNQSAGNLTGKTAATGGTWTAFGGDTDDWTMDTSAHTAQRTVTADTALPNSGVVGRAISAGTGTLATIAAEVDFKHSAVALACASGLLVRAAATTDYAVFYVSALDTLNGGFRFARIVASTGTLTALSSAQAPIVANNWYTMRVVIDAAGRWWMWYFPQGASPGSPVAVGQDSALATGGALASGKYGIYDGATSAATRSYDNFAVWTPVTDAAMFASQSLEIRSDRARREDSTGTLWAEPSSVEGSYLRPPPAGREGRQVRTAIKASRGPELAPGVVVDPAIDDISARHFTTPRYLVVPEA